MKTFTLGSVFALSCAVMAWEAEFYSTKDCNGPNDSGYEYVVYTGTGSSYCIDFQQETDDGVTCGYYTDGGENGPLSCIGAGPESFNSYSVASGRCQIYGAAACGSEITGQEGTGVCNPADIVSFTCEDGDS